MSDGTDDPPIPTPGAGAPQPAREQAPSARFVDDLNARMAEPPPVPIARRLGWRKRIDPFADIGSLDFEEIWDGLNPDQRAEFVSALSDHAFTPKDDSPSRQILSMKQVSDLKTIAAENDRTGKATERLNAASVDIGLQYKGDPIFLNPNKGLHYRNGGAASDLVKNFGNDTTKLVDFLQDRAGQLPQSHVMALLDSADLRNSSLSPEAFQTLLKIQEDTGIDVLARTHARYSNIDRGKPLSHRQAVLAFDRAITEGPEALDNKDFSHVNIDKAAQEATRGDPVRKGALYKAIQTARFTKWKLGDAWNRGIPGEPDIDTRRHRIRAPLFHPVAAVKNALSGITVSEHHGRPEPTNIRGNGPSSGKGLGAA